MLNAECLLARSGYSILVPLASSQHNLYDIGVYLLLCVQCWTPDDGQRNCPKHLEFYTKNEFEKSVYLVGSIIRIYHDAQSYKCQINVRVTWTLVQCISLQSSIFVCLILKQKTWEHSTCASLHLVINNIIERNHRHQNFNILYNEYLLNDIRSYVLVRGVINKNNFYRSRFVSTLYHSQGISPSRNLV